VGGLSIGRVATIACGLAKKKTRTPPPPRRPVQAPKRRADVRAPGESRRTLYFLVIFAASGIIVLGGLLLVLGLTGGSDAGSAAEQLRGAGCTYRESASEGDSHVPDGRKVQYKSFPPVSGDHYATPAIWNAYDQPLEQERAVHNLEHGGIVIQYGSKVPAGTVQELQQFYLDDPNGLILAPLPRLNDKIALTAWTKLATCTQFDEGAFSEFRDAFRAKGPEPRRIEDLRPGIAS
jgi:Protein of unknown function (DUF3105)